MLIEFLKTDFDFVDERGSLTQIVSDGWKQVNYITSKQGTLRGNHYHKNNNEAFYVIEGAFELNLINTKTKETENYSIKSGDFFKIGPYISHSFSFKKDTQLISFYDNGVVEGEIKDIYIG